MVDGLNGPRPEWAIPFFLTFAEDFDLPMVVEPQVFDVDLGHFGGSGAGVVSEEEDGVVSYSERCLLVGGIEEGAQLFFFQVLRWLALGGFVADGSDLLGLEVDVGIFSGDIAEEGFDDGESVVTCSSAPSSFSFTVVEEGEDLFLVDVFDLDMVGAFAEVAFEEAEQEFDAVAVRFDGVVFSSSFDGEILVEETA